MLRRIACLLAPILFMAACAPEEESLDEAAHDHTHGGLQWIDVEDPALALEPIEHHTTFEQVGLWLEGPTPTITARVRAAGEWGSWQPVEITWSEEDRHVGRVLARGDAIQFRGLHDQEVAGTEFLEERTAPEGVLTRDLPFAEPARSLTGAVAPRSLVIPRSEWGARSPDKICGSVVAPYRISIHHTASPDSDGGDPAARMRQMQAFHIDTRGWCDIGYHFVVSQSGEVYQARSDERRPGTHVGGENSGNVGVSLIGNYVSASPPQAQLDATIEIVAWISDTYAIPLERDVVKGHTEWPGQSTICPGAKMIDALDTILDGAVEPTIADIDISSQTSGLDDLLVQGTSFEKPDALPGDTFEVSLLLHNRSGSAIRDVELGYFIEEPHLVATDYVIETNAPDFGTTFVINDADSAEGNPAKDALGSEGSLTMYAFAANETKRVRITLEAKAPSIGLVDHPDVRGWVRNIDGIYAQEGFFDEPSTNNADEVLTTYVEHDVLSRDAWRFDADEAEMLEGWEACQEGVSRASVSTALGLSIETEGEDSCVVSPPWTSVDADTFDQLVIEFDTDAAPHRAAIFWNATGDAEFTAERAVTFPVDSDSATLVVDLAEHPEWKETIERLRLDPIEGEAVDGLVSVGALYFQSSAGTATTLPGIAFNTSDPISPITGAADPTGGTGGSAGSDGNRFQTNDGCAQGGPAPAAGSLLLVVTALFVLRRRRSA